MRIKKYTLCLLMSILILLVGYTSQNITLSASNQLDPDKYYGFCYSPFRSGQSPKLGIYPSPEQIREDLQFISKFTKRIRTYGTTDSLYNIPFFANEVGLKCYVGLWLDKDKATNEIEVRNVMKIVNSNLDNIEGIIVGNEVILRHDMRTSELLEYIRRVKNCIKSAGKKIPVGIADIYPNFYNNPSIVNEADFILIHIHPYWENIPAIKAPLDVITKYNSIKSRFPKKTIMIGETGYPSAGPKRGLAIPNIENQSVFFNSFTKLTREKKIPYFYFDVFDEDWKGLTEESIVGKYWGLYSMNGDKKSPSIDSIPLGFNRVPDKIYDTCTILYNEKLTSGFGMGIDDSNQFRNWVSNNDDSLKIQYPGGLAWGAVFINVSGKPVNSPRPYRDFSKYTQLAIEMKGTTGDEWVNVGLKDAQDPDDGSETKKPVQLTADWKTYTFDLPNFTTCQLSQIYVVAEFVFPCPDNNKAQTIEIRKITFLKTDSTGPVTSSLNETMSPTVSITPTPVKGNPILINGKPVSGFGMGVDDSNHIRNWVSITDNSLKMQYPGGLAWGAVFINVSGKPVNSPRPYRDFSKYTQLAIEMKGTTGDEWVNVGLKDAQDPDDGSETKNPVQLTADWKTYMFDLSSFTTCQLSQIYVVIEFVFPASDSNKAQTIEIRNISFLETDLTNPSVSSLNETLSPTASITPTPMKGNPILINGKLVSDFGMGVDDSNHIRNWVSITDNSLKMQYPGGLAWGAVFINVSGKPVNSPRPYRDFSKYTRIAIEMKGATGGEWVNIGLKDAQDPDDGSETKKPVQLTADWKTYTFNLSSFTTCQRKKIYVVTEFVFPCSGHNQAQTIEIKNITFLEAD